jgi:hypothetical protein
MLITTFTTMIIMTPLFFIVPGAFALHIHATIMFDIIRSTGVDPDVHTWWCRQKAIDTDIQIGRSRKTGWYRKSGISLIEAEGNGHCGKYQQGYKYSFSHYNSFFVGKRCCTKKPDSELSGITRGALLRAYR